MQSLTTTPTPSAAPSLHDEFSLPTCPPWCQAAHIEPGVTDDHWTGQGDAFGEHVIVNQAEGQAPGVRLCDLPRPAADFTADGARMLAVRLWTAADFADRAALQATIDTLARRLYAATGGGA
jgi:hypothetical protein